MKTRHTRGVAVIHVMACTWASAAIQCVIAEEPTFRDLTRKYFKDGNGADLAKLVGYNEPVKKVIALEYKVLLSENGKETPVDPKTHEFKVGDKIRVSIEPLSDYYVYIYQIGASGQSGFLLPAKDEDPPLAKTGNPVALPDDGFFEFTAPPGEETLMVVAAEKPIANRAVLASILGKKPGEKDTPEEKAVREYSQGDPQESAQVGGRNEQGDYRPHRHVRGITAEEKPMRQLAEEIRTRGVKDGTFEEPSANGTSVLYMSCNEKAMRGSW